MVRAHPEVPEPPRPLCDCVENGKRVHECHGGGREERCRTWVERMQGDGKIHPAVPGDEHAGCPRAGQCLIDPMVTHIGVPAAPVALAQEPLLTASGRVAMLDGAYSAADLRKIADALDSLAGKPAAQDLCTCPIPLCLEAHGTRPDHLRCQQTEAITADVRAPMAAGKRVAGETYESLPLCDCTLAPGQVCPPATVAFVTRGGRRCRASGKC